MQSRIIYSITFYMLLMSLMYITKPKIMFTDDGEIIPFGLDKYQTLYSFSIFTVVSSILTFYMFCVIDLIFS